MFSIFQLIELFNPFIAYFTALLAGGVGIAYITELLKSPKVKKLPVSKYPRTTAAILSVVATIIGIFTLPVDIVFQQWYQIAFFTLGSFFVSAIYYNQIIDGTKLTDNSNGDNTFSR